MKEIKEQEKEQRRNHILDTAEKLFFSKGYDNVSMDEIANELEINKATLYIYFKNKESLFLAIVLRGVKIMHTMISKEVRDDRTGIETLSAIATAYLTFVNNYRDYNKASFTLCQEDSLSENVNDNE